MNPGLYLKTRNHQDNHQNPAEVGQMDLEAADPTLGDLAVGNLPFGKKPCANVGV